MNRLARYIWTPLFLFLATTSQAKKNEPLYGTTDYIATLKKVTDIMVNDVTSPVAASRYYAYITMAASEVQALFNPGKVITFRGRLQGFTGISSQINVNVCNEAFAVVYMVAKMGEKLLPSGYLLKPVADSMAQNALLKGVPESVADNTKQLIQGCIEQLMVYVKADGFTKMANLRRYTPTKGDAWWQPTQPAFMTPVEPHWKTLRTFTLDSAQQYKTKPPVVYDTMPASPYMVQLTEVYNIGRAATKEQQEQAMFWDCNPFAIQQIGHVQFGLKKISPGGHWIGITGIACHQQKVSLQQTVLSHALVSIALADAFIACWDEKYRTNRLRPETAINRLIDPRWHPLLQTPPFPEYVSGHSVASMAAATVLTKLFGNHFAFNDDSEVEFDLPVRHYTSFMAAAEEAAISRLYGGIHYRDAITEGVWQGKMVGQWVTTTLQNAFASLTKK